MSSSRKVRSLFFFSSGGRGALILSFARTKKGTIDALIAAQKHDPWNPPADLRERMDRAFSEIRRVLTPTGVFISITFGQPHFRKPFMLKAKHGWECSQQSFGGFGQYFVYALRCHPGAQMEDMDFGPPSHLKVTPRQPPADGEREDSDEEEQPDYLLTIGDI